MIGARAAAILTAVLVTSAALDPGGGSEQVLTPTEHRRPPEQTYLTYPEWFLVYSPAEYADHVERQRPSRFPFLGHVGQFWQGYRAVHEATKDRYPFNPGYHAMVLVIGASTTIEYGLKATWETLVGRLTEIASGGIATDEDRLAARAARDYVEFLDLQPWYRYDFAGDLASLWTETKPWGPGLIRKWERRYFLTSEYVAKAAYGWIIGKATGAAYEAASPETVVVLDRASEPALGAIPDMRVMEVRPGGEVVAALPRYAPFAERASLLARSGAGFLEIAGNRGEILVSLLAPAGWPAEGAPGRVILTQPILTRPGTKRLLLAVDVPSLATALGEIERASLVLEHVYDY